MNINLSVKPQTSFFSWLTRFFTRSSSSQVFSLVVEKLNTFVKKIKYFTALPLFFLEFYIGCLIEIDLDLDMDINIHI